MTGRGAADGRRARWSALLPPLALALGALFLLLHFDLKPVLGDEGVTAVDAWRMARGEIPHRDFFEIVPPLSAGLLSWAFSLFGLGTFTLRAAGVLYGAALLGLTYLAARRFCPLPAAAALPLALLVPFGVGAWPFPSHHWLADLLCLAALLALLRALEGAVLPYATLGGAALAGACFTLQDQGGLALLAALAVLFWVVPGRRGRYFGGLALGGLAATLAVWFLWLPADPVALWHDWFAFPASQYRRIPDNAVDLLDAVSHLGRQWDLEALRLAPLHAGSVALASTLLFLLPLACLPAAWALWREQGRPKAETVLLLGFAAAFVGTALHRWSLMNLIWAAPLPAIVVASALGRGANSQAPWVRRSVATLLGICLAVFLAAGLLRIAFVLRVPGHAVSGPAGSYRTFNPHEARALQEFVDAIQSRVPAGEGAFVRGFIPLASFLTLRPNPTPFTFYLPSGYQTPSQAERWTRSLESGPVRWGFSTDTPLDLTDPADVYLAARYRVVWRNGVFCLWERLP